MAKRHPTENTSDHPPSKMQKLLEDVYTCPITLEIPFDPVFAEDGIVYERFAIQSWFDSNSGDDEVRSPVTNQAMRPRLYPAIQFKKFCRTLFDEGDSVTGELAVRWRNLLRHEEKCLQTQRRAEKGDRRAMIWLSRAYTTGSRGIAKDARLAFHWTRLAAEAGDPTSLSALGHMYISGWGGVVQNLMTGLVHMTRAAEFGSEHACHYLGFSCKDGGLGLECDENLGKHYILKSFSCKIRDSSVVMRSKAFAYKNRTPLLRPATSGRVRSEGR